jgi:hypothetical protein
VECKSISGSGDQVRVTLKGPLKCDRLFAGVAATPPATTTVPVELKIGGQSGCNIPAGQEVTTDFAALTVSAGQTLIVGVDHADDGGAWFSNPPPWEGNPGMPNCDQWWAPGDSWNVASPSGFSENVGLCVAVSSIEVFNDAPPPPPTGLNIVSGFVLAEANGEVNPVATAFMGSSVAGMEWATAEIGAGVNGVSWFGQKFRTAKEIRKITFAHKDAATSVSSVHVLYGSDPATLSVAGPFAVGMTADFDLPALGSHVYWRVRANSAPSGRWHVRNAFMYAYANEWEATPTWVQAYIETNIPWTANSNVINGEPQALQVVPINARWCDTFNEFDPVTYRYTAKRPGKRNFRVRVQLSGTGITGVHLHIVKNADPTGGFYRPVYHGDGNHGFDINVPVAIGDQLDVRMQIEQGTDIVIDGHRSLFEVF